jgi:hypothetical protein
MWLGEIAIVAVELSEAKLPVGMEVDRAMVRLPQFIASIHDVL